MLIWLSGISLAQRIIKSKKKQRDKWLFAKEIPRLSPNISGGTDIFTHAWIFDWPWEMVKLRDWFYMVNVGYIESTVFLHVRFFGIRSLWTYLEYFDNKRNRN